MNHLDVATARTRDDLRLVLTTGVPGPWGETAKGLFHIKGIVYTPVAQRGGGENDELREWTGHDNAPIVVSPGSSPRTGWAEILLFAEAHNPEPALIPADPRLRASMFGWCHELAGEDGLGWNRRLMMLHRILGVPALAESGAGELARRLGGKYGYGAESAAAAPARVADILEGLGAQLREQRAAGSRYLVGESLTAADVFWATFAALVSPLPPEQCRMPDFLRSEYALPEDFAAGGELAALLAHRDFVYAEHLVLPVDC